MRSAEEVIHIIEGRKNKGNGLDCFKDYMEEIGNPHLQLQCIHIAGTNGKGSTLNFLRSMLQEEGYRVGTFSSPYLQTHRDRIRINDEFISEEDFAEIADRYYAGWMRHDLSMFEIDMAIASVYFLEQGCDLCVFEVGLGGRLDLTNIIDPLLSVITNIGMDHMEQLGTTYEAIAKEKAGIVKAFRPLISSEEKQNCIDVFTTACHLHHSPYHQVKQAYDITYQPNEIQFSYQDFKNLILHNGARYQIKNASCALEAILQLQQAKQIHIQEESIRSGLCKAQWKGRFETIYEHPTILVDGAHNKEGMQALVQSIRPLGEVRILFAALKDKKTNDMMDILQTVSTQITVTSFPFYRAASAKDIAQSYHVSVDEDYQHAVLTLLQDTKTPIIITGSLYFISQVRDFVSRLK